MIPKDGILPIELSGQLLPLRSDAWGRGAKGLCQELPSHLTALVPLLRNYPISTFKLKLSLILSHHRSPKDYTFQLSNYFIQPPRK